MIVCKPKKRLLKPIFISLLLLQVLNDSTAQIACQGNWYPLIKQRLVPNVNVSPHIKGYIEYLPASYWANPNKKFPLLLFLTGRGAVGAGDSASLCFVASNALPLKIEEGTYPEVVYSNGQSFSYIVLSPQYNVFPGTTPQDINAMIDYAISHYRVDATRIYLTGLSSGANIIMDYVSSNINYAKRIAGITTLGVCYSPASYQASTVANARDRYWGIHCEFDDLCNSDNSVNWANGINAFAYAGPLGKFTLTPVYNPSFPHDIWYRVYDSSWKENGQSVYQWMIQFSQPTALPIQLNKFQVTARNKQAIVEWSSSLESESDHFIIERSPNGADFYEIGKVAAAGNSAQVKEYSFADKLPLKGNSFYRLSLVSRDGSREYEGTRKLTNNGPGVRVVLMPVPTKQNLQVLFTINTPQKVSFSILDVKGRKLESWSANFVAGNFSLPVSVDKLAAGIYYFSIRGTEFIETNKFIKQ